MVLKTSLWHLFSSQAQSKTKLHHTAKLHISTPKQYHKTCRIPITKIASSIKEVAPISLLDSLDHQHKIASFVIVRHHKYILNHAIIISFAAIVSEFL